MHCFGEGDLVSVSLWLRVWVSQHRMAMLLTSHVILVL